MLPWVRTCRLWNPDTVNAQHNNVHQINGSAITVSQWYIKVKGKVLPYSLLSFRSGADPGVQAVSPQVTWSESRHKPGGRLPLLSARPAVTRSPLQGCYQLIPLGDGSTWVLAACSRLLPNSAMAGNWTHDHWIIRPMPLTTVLPSYRATVVYTLVV